MPLWSKLHISAHERLYHRQLGMRKFTCGKEMQSYSSSLFYDLFLCLNSEVEGKEPATSMLCSWQAHNRCVVSTETRWHRASGFGLIIFILDEKIKVQSINEVEYTGRMCLGDDLLTFIFWLVNIYMDLKSRLQFFFYIKSFQIPFSFILVIA